MTTVPFSQRVQVQFMHPDNIAYLREGLRKIAPNLGPRIRDLMMLFMKTHGNGYDLSVLDAQRGMSEEKKFWLAVQNLNKMFLDVLKEHAVDGSDAAIGQYGYAEAMFIATEMRPSCYEGLNDDTFIGAYNGSSSCNRSPFERPFDKYRSAVLAHGAVNQEIPDREHIYGADTKLGDPSPYHGPRPSAGFAPRPRMQGDGITPDLDDWALNKMLMQASVNDQTYPEHMMDLYQRGISPNDQEEDDGGYSYSSGVLDEIIDSRGNTISYGNDTFSLHPETYEGSMQAHVARYGKHKYSTLDKDGSSGMFPWFQNLSKRHFERKGDRDDDMLDGTMQESQQRSTRGWKVSPDRASQGDGFRFRSIYPIAPEKDRETAVFEPDPKVSWNRELGHKLRPMGMGSMISARR